SRAYVKAFSFTSNFWRAASHSCAETTLVCIANLLFVGTLVALLGRLLRVRRPFRPAAGGRIPAAGGPSHPRMAPVPCRWRGRPGNRGACGGRGGRGAGWTAGAVGS